MEEQKIDPEYINGFEHGYWLQRGGSKELDGIIERSKQEHYKSGLKAGKKQATREKVRERLNDIKDQSQSRDIGIDLD